MRWIILVLHINWWWESLVRILREYLRRMTWLLLLIHLLIVLRFMTLLVVIALVSVVIPLTMSLILITTKLHLWRILDNLLLLSGKMRTL